MTAVPLTVTTFQIPLVMEVAPFGGRARPSLELKLEEKDMKVCAEKIS